MWGVEGMVLGVYCLPKPISAAEGDKMNLTANVKITDNHKSRKQAAGVNDES